ncbi:MAG: GspE/PulE family protein [bacterium]
MVKYLEVEQNKLISDLRSQEEEALTQHIADDIGVPYIDLTGQTINTDALKLITIKVACGMENLDELKKLIGIDKLSSDEQMALNKKVLESGEMATFAMVGKKLEIAVKSPTNPITIAEVNRLEGLGYQTNLSMASSRSLKKAWGRYNDISASEAGRGGLLDISDENLQEIVTNVHKDIDVETRLKKIFEEKDSHQISKIMETVFGSGIALGSSDVHFEPEETFTRLRLREDGVLQEIARIDPVIYQRLLNRVKFISGMKLTDVTTAQDGRFTIVYKGMDVEVRVAVAPGAYNQSIVLRILNPEGLAVDFEKLGIQPKLFKILEREISKPNGMILTTGPTGSGKTTTLYSFLKKVYDPGNKIITIEDPIEYHLPGITQEQVSHEKGFDFLAGLRAALRQDPDIIMVGEIRDKETATIAVNASLTGHMVFSTLHTNSAAGTIPRLLDLGIQPGILAAALTVSIAQRLLRKLCPACKKAIELEPDKMALLKKIVENAERLGKDMATYNVSSSMNMVVYGPVGCEKCNMTGFKGRVGLYEAILTDDIIAKEMTKVPTPTERDIKKAAEHQKILTMIEDGVVKILSGLTSYDEVQEVVDLSEDVQVTVGSELPSGSADNKLRSEDQERIHSESLDQKPLRSSAASNLLSTNPDLDSSSGEEIALLVDYLKILEDHQKKNPEVGIADKIARVQHMIISLLENNPHLDQLFTSVNPGIVVRDQIEGLMSELKTLEADQTQNPNLGIADKIASIRNTIQSMRSEVVK